LRVHGGAADPTRRKATQAAEKCVGELRVCGKGQKKAPQQRCHDSAANFCRACHFGLRKQFGCQSLLIGLEGFRRADWFVVRLSDHDVSRMTRASVPAKAALSAPVSCFYRAAGIYSGFALKRVARRGGRKPTFLLGRLECTANRLWSGSL
jgi:hypothetical protein